MKWRVLTVIVLFLGFVFLVLGFKRDLVRRWVCSLVCFSSCSKVCGGWVCTSVCTPKCNNVCKWVWKKVG